MWIKFFLILWLAFSAHSKLKLIDFSDFLKNFTINEYINKSFIFDSIIHNAFGSEQVLQSITNSKSAYSSNIDATLLNSDTEPTEVVFWGSISKDFRNSARLAGLEPKYIHEFEKIFSSEIDFSREIRRKDEWAVVIEKVCDETNLCFLGKILAAKFKRGNKNHYAFYYKNEEYENSYFSLQGESLSKIFLKSPVDSGRVTSKYARRRFHPILKIFRPHLGIDYAAPKGTKIRAVADGIIEKAGWYGDAGIMVEIRHFEIYKTAYKHLLKISNSVKVGENVRQGQVIGYVGKTGLATAPHVHFEFYRDGRFVDPIKIDFPPSETLEEKHMEEFSLVIEKYKPLLKERKIASTTASNSN